MKITLPAVALATAFLLACSACDRSVEVVAPVRLKHDANEPAPLTHTYHTRGIIKSIPVAGNPAAELQIQHEAINDFVDGAGAVVGMNAMTMPFPRLADGVSLQGLAIGDKVAFSFINTWSGPAGSRRPDWVINSLTKLPADTELVFGKKQTPAPTSEAGPRPEGGPEPEPESK